MRTVPMPEGGMPDEGQEGTAIVDWKESPHTVLDIVDDLLKPLGLEIIQYDTDTDCYWFRIGKKE
jgi:hypothetical protein